MRLAISLLAVALAFSAAPASAQTIREASVRAHEAFLASDALRGRGSATPDEAVAAAYVASQFQSYGLVPAPGMDGYLQTATVVTPKLDGHATLMAGGSKVAEGQGLTVLWTNGAPVSGKVAVAASPDAVPQADIVIVPDLGKATTSAFWRAARAKGTKLVIVRDNDDARGLLGRIGGKTGVPITLEEGGSMGGSRPDLIALSADAFASLAAGADVTFNLPGAAMSKSLTTNAIGYLPGSDPSAGVILITAHMDHLGMRDDGTIMHGANDDASGTVAVLEIAEAMAEGPQPRRGILFVGYGSEEIGGLGSTYFGAHPPIPLDQIVANLEFEMIGAHDPKMEAGVMMMTGFDRSTLGETLKAKGAAVAPDLYPEEHFFERSDNYSLALKGIVAHTISGWAVTPTYHDPSDDIAHIDFPFMVQAIQSLIVPVEYLANSDFKPQWKGEGQPKP